MEEYLTAKEMCNEFGCIMGCIDNHDGHDIYFLREKDEESLFLMDYEFIGFLFCPDCGSKIERR